MRTLSFLLVLFLCAPISSNASDSADIIIQQTEAALVTERALLTIYMEKQAVAKNQYVLKQTQYSKSLISADREPTGYNHYVAYQSSKSVAAAYDTYKKLAEKVAKQIQYVAYLTTIRDTQDEQRLAIEKGLLQPSALIHPVPKSKP